jgi:hypothetical protein
VSHTHTPPTPTQHSKVETDVFAMKWNPPVTLQTPCCLGVGVGLLYCRSVLCLVFNSGAVPAMQSSGVGPLVLQYPRVSCCSHEHEGRWDAIEESVRDFGGLLGTPELESGLLNQRATDNRVNFRNECRQ